MRLELKQNNNNNLKTEFKGEKWNSYNFELKRNYKENVKNNGFTLRIN